MDQLPLRKILLAILSGLLITASFPPLKTDWLIWISIIPLLISLEETSPRTALKLGIIAGLAHYLSLIYWIINVISTYGGLDIFTSLFTLFLLCLYLSLYMGLFSLLIVYFGKSRLKIFFFAEIWVSLEYIRTILFTGFPWGLLGYTQYNWLSIAQVADITGVYGISFIIIAFNILIFQMISRHKNILKNKYYISQALILFIVVSITVLYGNNRLKQNSINTPENQKINIAIIQGNIDQAIKWNNEFQEITLNKYLNLTRNSYDTNPDIIIWPETAVPLFFQDNSPLTQTLYSIPRESGAHFIFGSPAYERSPDTTKYYNRAWYISPEGQISGKYDKIHLVPFGEYVPLKKFLPFVHRLVPAAGDFSIGNSTEPLSMDGLLSGTLLCYEVIFPDISRVQTLKGAQVLINLTNDAWFGYTSAPYQHLFMSVFRAIENRRPLIRSANTGISAIVDSTGAVITHGGLFTEEIVTGTIILKGNSLSLYSRFGDIFAIGILILCLIKIFIGLCYSDKKITLI